MTSMFRTRGIKEKIMKDLTELNGYHEVTERVYQSITQPEWQTILSKHYPGIALEGKNVNVDLSNEIITID